MDELRLAATTDALERIQAAILDRIERFGATEESVFDVRLAIEEMVGNVIRYAYPGGSGELEVGWELDADGRLRVLVRDWGRPFNPIAHPNPDLTVDFGERPVGGMGICLVRQLVQKWHYERRGPRNVLELVFHISRRPGCRPNQT
jgi:anti-sigma regulatory factor (Ser/Thr protein kinase)